MSSYSVQVLPSTGDNLSLYSAKYSALRIKALTQNPSAFSSNIDTELRLTDGEKMARLQRPQQQVLVVVENSSTSSNNKHWLEEEWVGQVTLCGPLTKQQYDEPFTIFRPNSGPTTYTFEDEKEDSDSHHPSSYWHMTALYVDTNHRGKGLAKLICLESFEVARGENRKESANMRIIIHPDNTVVINMYKALGFKVAHQQSTLAEAIVASGDVANLPDDFKTKERYTSRGGIIMIRHIS